MKKKINTWFVFLLLFLLPLAGCGGSEPRTDIPVAKPGDMPVAPLAERLPTYRLQVGDVLEVSLLLNPELNEEVTVRPDGMISTAVARNVRAYGKTTAELQEALVKSYKKHLTDPELNVVVKQFTPSRVYVLGEVVTPGEMVSIGPNMTLLQALARAGGLRNSADENNILIFRRGASEKHKVFRADYESATSGNEPGQDIRLAAYDVVYVPPTGVANAYKAFQQNVQQFLPTTLGFGFGN